MLRERSFRRNNGKEVRLRELTDLVALRASKEVAPPPAATATEQKRTASSRRGKSSRRTRIESRMLDTIAPEVSLPEVRAFEDAGWVFVPNQDSSDVNAEAPQEAKVFVKQGGRLALGTNRLVVKLHDDPSEQQANEILRPYGCRVLNQLKFAPGLFSVEVTDQAHGDTLDVASNLTTSGVCEFAEPELIEAIGGR